MGLLGLPALPASAQSMSGASYRSVAGGFAAVAGPEMTASGPGTSATGTGGQSGAPGLSGTAFDLETNAAGFWYAVLGGAPGLDGDGDGISVLVDNCAGVSNADQLDFDGDAAGDACDPDDDADGLPDAVETNSGVLASPSDTGTDPLNADTDGDGFDDGAEVAAGSDPNHPLSTPLDPNPPVPVLAALARGLLAALLALVAAVCARHTATRR